MRRRTRDPDDAAAEQAQVVEGIGYSVLRGEEPLLLSELEFFQIFCVLVVAVLVWANRRNLRR